MPDLPLPYLQAISQKPTNEDPLSSSRRRSLVISLVGILLLLITVPAGVYLVQQQTNFKPQAVQEKNVLPIRPTSLSLSAKKLEITVLASTDSDEANLFVSNIQFPPESLQVEKITTSDQLKINRLIKSDYDNTQGIINLITAAPSPGVKTKPNQQLVLAKITFKPLQKGRFKLNFEKTSAIFRNKDSVNILENQNNLDLEVTDQPQQKEDASPSANLNCKTQPNCLLKEGSSDDSFINLKTPKGGSIFSYTKQIPVSWQSKGVKTLSLSLFLNNNPLGQIATVAASLNQTLINPSLKLPPSFIIPQNSFQLELSGLSDQGKLLKSNQLGPFMILGTDNLPPAATQSAQINPQQADFNRDGQTNLTDLSLLLGKLFADKEVIKYDLNGDGYINDLDLFFFEEILNQKNLDS